MDSPSKFTLLTKSYTRLDFDSHAMTIYGIIPCNVMRADFKGESRAHNQAIQLNPVLACFRLEFDRQSCVKFSCDLRQFKCTIVKLSYRFFVDGYVLHFVIIKI